ncbi:MAG: DUF2330 domain-containing protein [Armatimonadetes bacterium]|nr:DUF2330 domain-containing protein [Armatimonadota bacterium]
MSRICSVLLALSLALAALADGMFVGKPGARAETAVSSAAQKAVIIYTGGRETLLLQTTYSGPAAEFAWVVPVPALPTRQDIFPASKDFIQGALEATQPRVTTRLIDPFESEGPGPGGRGMSPGESPGAPGMPGAPGAPAVTVHERFTMGQFDVAVLSAVGATDLLRWLKAKGFALPSGGEDIIGEYLHKHWYFVALRINPEATAKQGIIQEVSPLGISFPAKAPVFPLRISAVSAPPRTSLILVVMGDKPFAPVELPAIQLPDKTRLRRGDSYSAFLRRQIEKRQGKALVAEFEGKTYYPDKARWGADARSPLRSGPGRPREFTTCRYVGLVPRETMLDLSFREQPAQRFSTMVKREAYLPVPLAARLALMRWPVAAVGVPLLVIVFWAGRRQGRNEALPERPAWMRVIITALGVYVVALFTVALAAYKALPRYPEVDLSGSGPPGTYVVLALGLLLSLVVLVGLPLSRLAGVIGLATLLSAAGLPLLLARHVDSVTPLAVALSCLALAVAVLLNATTRTHVHAVVAVAAVLALFVGPLPRMGHGDSWMRQYEVQTQLDDQLRDLRGAVKNFRAVYGCYPATVNDLASSHHTTGQDPSGNPVSIAATSQPYKPLSALPRDPLTGRTDKWLLDVLAPDVIDSGAYKVTVEVSR